MGFLQQFLKYEKIYIQCHNNPDADSLASGFGLYRYFHSKGIDTKLIYGGSNQISKHNLKTLIELCEIPIQYVSDIPQPPLLITVDGQYGQGNVEKFDSKNVGIIDHHIDNSIENNPLFLIKSNYQSCSTVVWELLLEEGYPVEDDKLLQEALLYGLYTDTSSFYDLFNKQDIEMRNAITGKLPIFNLLIKSAMTLVELLVASDAIHNHVYNIENKFSIVSAIRCDQVVLGIIGDMMIQVDIILLNLCFTTNDSGYQISIRSCTDAVPANLLAKYICDEIGSGGGHEKKAGGQISQIAFTNKYGSVDMVTFFEEKMSQFLKLPR